MAANQLSIISLFSRSSALIQNDHLVFLNHQGGRDRVRRLYFDTVESLLIYKTWPWQRMLVVATIGAIFIALLLAAMIESGDDDVLTIMGVYVAIPVAIAETYYAVLRKTNFVITRRGHAHKFTVIAPGHKTKAFATLLTINIKTAQMRCGKAALEKQREIVDRAKSDFEKNASVAKDNPES